ncbi:unnamed protein product [Urochloa humidicola]
MPPPHTQPTPAPQPAPPTLLRREPAPIRPASPSSVSVATWYSSSPATSPRTPLRSPDLDLSRYFLETPPPPPIHGRPCYREESVVPDTPASVQRTYAEVVKSAPSPTGPLRAQPPRQRLQSAINAPVRSTYYGWQRRSPPRSPPRPGRSV